MLARRLRQEFENHVNRLHGEMSDLANSIQNFKNSIDKQQKASEECHQSPITAVTELRTQIPIGVEDKTKKTKKEWTWAITKGALEVTVGVAVIAYTLVTWNIWGEQADATNFAGIQARKARETLNEATKNFRVDERAWLVPAFQHKINPSYQTRLGSNTISGFQYENRGKTPAKNISGRVVISAQNPDDIFDFSTYAKGMPIRLGALVPGGVEEMGINLTKLSPEGRRAPIDWNDELRQEVYHGKIVIVGYGEITYFDIFNKKPHFVRFCRILEAAVSVKIPSSGVEPIPDIYKRCASSNSIDSN